MRPNPTPAPIVEARQKELANIQSMGMITPPTDNRRQTRNSIKNFETGESKITINGGSTEEKEFPKQEASDRSSTTIQLANMLGRRTRNNTKRIESEDCADSVDAEEEEKSGSKRVRYF